VNGHIGGNGKYIQGGLDGFQIDPARPDNPIHIIVGPVLVEVKKSEFFHPGPAGKIQYIIDAGMTPAFFSWIFILCIFPVMEENVCIPGKIKIGVKAPAFRMIKPKLIIRQKHKSFAVLEESISHSAVVMAGGYGFNPYGSNGKGGFRIFYKFKPGLEIIQGDGEKRGFHDLVQDIPGTDAGEQTILDDQTGFAELKGFEKSNAHDMVPMGMGQEQMILADIPVHEGIAQAPQACPGVNNKGFPGFGRNFNTGRVPSVSDIGRA
jgi:hypothetical protein